MAEPKHVLIVDDAAAFRRLLRHGLSRFPGAVCEEAADGAQAIQALDRRHFDLVLCDVNMPVLDGLSLLAEIRRRPDGKDLPVVVLTVGDGGDDSGRALAAGASAFLTKPILLPQLLEVVGRFLG